MREVLLNIFKNVKNRKSLEAYVDYCLKHKQTKAKKYKTELHHILPRSLYPNYSNLSTFSWNGAHLPHDKHLMAHHLLFDAIDEWQMRYAWLRMTNYSRYGDIIKESASYSVKREQCIREHSMREIQRYKDNPDLGLENSARQKQFHKDNPTFAKQQGKLASKTLKRRFVENPALRKELSVRTKMFSNSPQAIMRKGYYITPNGIHTSLVGEISVRGGKSLAAFIRKCCKNNHLTIKAQSVLNNARTGKGWMTTQDVGKTYAELGFKHVFPKTLLEAQEIIESSAQVLK